MGDLIDLKTHMESICGDDNTAEFEIFLAEEGLELLSDFRSISDRLVRDSVRDLIKSMAHSKDYPQSKPSTSGRP